MRFPFVLAWELVYSIEYPSPRDFACPISNRRIRPFVTYYTHSCVGKSVGSGIACTMEWDVSDPVVLCVCHSVCNRTGSDVPQLIYYITIHNMVGGVSTPDGSTLHELKPSRLETKAEVTITLTIALVMG